MGCNLLEFTKHSPPGNSCPIQKAERLLGLPAFQNWSSPTPLSLATLSQWRDMLGCASRRPGTLDMPRHRVDNQRAHTCSRKPPQRESKHWNYSTVGYNHYLLAYSCTGKNLQKSSSKRRVGKRWLLHTIIIALQNSWQLELKLCWWPAQFLSPYWSIWNITTTFLPFWKINQNY